MKISDVVRRTGLSQDTIRYYEKLGLIQTERVGKNREYTEEQVMRLNGIQLLKQASFSLNEIEKFMTYEDKFMDMDDIYNMSDEDYSTLIELINSKQQQIDTHIQNLQRAQKSLQAMKTKLYSLERES